MTDWDPQGDYLTVGEVIEVKVRISASTSKGRTYVNIVRDRGMAGRGVEF